MGLFDFNKKKSNEGVERTEEIKEVVNEEVQTSKSYSDPELDRFQINLSLEEKVVCLKEILDKFKKILYVYDKSQDPKSGYKYKVYCGGIAIYVSSSNTLFNGELVNLIVNLNAILQNDFDKPQIKRIVFESINFVEYLLDKYENEQKEQNNTKEQNGTK